MISKIVGRKHRLNRQGGVSWSFLTASSHGAGLMLVPVVLPLCVAAGAAGEQMASGSAAVALAALGVHTAAMLTVIAVVAFAVYEWIGLAFLRRGWINLDALWSMVLVASG